MFCRICHKEVNSVRGLINHLNTHNIKSKEYYDKYIKLENEGLCIKCGKETSFITITKGYRDFCSNSCCNQYTNQKEETKKKIKQTLLKKYGKENYVNVDKCKETKLQKYGYEYFPSYENMKKLSKEEELNRVKKILKTKKNKYGDSTYCNVDKIKKTKLKKYGNDTYNNSIKISETFKSKNSEQWLEIIEKRFEKLKEVLLIQYKDLLKQNKIYNVNIVNCEKNSILMNCLKCGYDFNIQPQLLRKRIKDKRHICTLCNPLYNKNVSHFENDLFNFIKKYYNNSILVNVKNIINPYELDIYLPEKKLAFEFNGLYWHSELYKDKNYHLMKTKECEKNNIHLIHIYEDDWIYKQNIVKSRILNLLGKSNKIYARQCELKIINNKDSKKFIEENHIQGFVPSKINLGLFKNGDLLSVMVFGNLRTNLGQKSKKNHWELLRFCNKLNTSVVGGAQKLFKYFIKNYNPLYVISYADRSWTMDNNNTLYDKLGFIKNNSTRINYYYVIDGIRKNRFNFRKDILIKNGYDSNKTEREIMFEREIYRIYDSGNLKYIWSQ